MTPPARDASRPGRASRATRAARRARRRRVGLGLLAFGVSGLVLIAAAAGLVLASLSAVDDAATGFERQRAELVGMLGPASDALADAATSAANAGASLTETRDAAGSAAALTTRLAESFESMAALGSFELLGTRPFGTVAGQFAAVAIEARTLSADLQLAAIAMDTNIADSAAVAENLRRLAEQLERLEESLGGPAEGPSSTAASSPGSTAAAGDGAGLPASSSSLPVAVARFVLMGMLAWLAIPAVASIWLGWRWSRPDPEA